VIKLVDRYVGRAAILGILGVWILLTLLFVVFSLLDELNDTQSNYDTIDALWFTALSTPRMAYQVFPISALLGALVGVGGLAAANELVAFRTSGASRLRLALAALAGTFLLTIPVIWLGEWVAPAADQQARAFRLTEIVGQATIGGTRGVWMRDGEDIVNIQRPLMTASRDEQTVEFKDVAIYRFSDNFKLVGITRADSASHDGRNWTLENLSEVSLGREGASGHEVESETWASDVKPEMLESVVARPFRLSVRSLWEYLGYLRENELDDSVYQSAFWEKVLYPFSVFALVMAGMPFVFGQARSQNLGVRLFFGMSVGGVFMIVSRSFQKVSAVYDISPGLGMSIPIVLLAIGAIVALRRSV
jgi:lipopolysaccharide export system permease protein